MNDSQTNKQAIALPDQSALAVGIVDACWMTTDGEVARLDLRQSRIRLERARPILCHRLATARRLKTAPFAALDVLELFAFVHPARFCLPTPKGLAEALDIAIPATLEQEAQSLLAATASLLDSLSKASGRDAEILRGLATTMQRGGWGWSSAVTNALGGDAPHSRVAGEAFKVWNRLPKWEETAGEAPAGNWPVEAVEARAKLVKLLGPRAEKRDQQMDYAGFVADAFSPAERPGEPVMVLAEAGTGVGKTLGYIAPAAVWAEKNEAPVWISTYTRNLQRQLDGELDRLFPDPAEKAERVVVRKGRENYFCLLNFDEAVGRIPINQRDGIALGIMARWVDATRDGDMVGGDFPAWLGDLLGRGLSLDLTDTRGECIYGACQHYGRCFIESAQRRSRRADIVVANHALVLIQAALGGDDGTRPTRYVIDEGHHLFDAADSAFSAHLTGQETAELRRWLLGAESERRSRSRGLKARLQDLATGSDAVMSAMDDVLKAAHSLPSPGWMMRISDGATSGPTEVFLQLVRQQVQARAGGNSDAYSLETDTRPPVEGLLDAAHDLRKALGHIGKPVGRLIAALAKVLDDDADTLETTQKNRIESLMQSLERRAIQQLAAWNAMLDALDKDPPEDFVDWLTLDRWQGRDMDVGLHRHWIDPAKPFAKVMADEAHGLLVTSATLTDGGAETAEDAWDWAHIRSGARHLPGNIKRTRLRSPFDYENNTRVIIVNDVDRNRPDAVAAAYRELFLAAGGGALGLFTAISRLKAVHERMAPAIDAAGLPLYAQHVDAMDIGTLIDIFRAEDNACLLGTDAVRDGVDVPGDSLKLIVFDRVPWPRPDILHKDRRKAFGGKLYDERLVRLKLAQAYGRLIRRASDRGVFVMLDRAMPSRLCTAFPDGVQVRRMGLKDALQDLRDFYRGS